MEARERTDGGGLPAGAEGRQPDPPARGTMRVGGAPQTATATATTDRTHATSEARAERRRSRRGVGFWPTKPRQDPHYRRSDGWRVAAQAAGRNGPRARSVRQQ